MNNIHVQKNTLDIDVHAEEVNVVIVHTNFILFGDIKDVKISLNQTKQKHRSFAFITICRVSKLNFAHSQGRTQAKEVKTRASMKEFHTCHVKSHVKSHMKD